ncbi:GNAT family N-acetyltransferase [Paenibacillus typhae]|uniref:Acetyltransferase (GNAT) family protein n=1 Tax=Paenibacillus typhae TaxID=1174501 RepID=A0A1G8XRM3_9BACL|nr:Acetyltransferase (GNAT) family protein [Paenibacillus typhae]
MLGDWIIRNVDDGDEGTVAAFGFALHMHYLYHGDFEQKNMFLAVKDNEALALAHLTFHDTFHAAGHDDDPEFIRYLTGEISFGGGEEDEAVKDALLDTLIARAREIKAQYPHKRIVLNQYIDTGDLGEQSYYLKRGFTVYETIVILKYDLTRPVPVYPLPDDVQIRPFLLNHDEAREKYHQAEQASFDGVAWSLNHLAWMQGTPEMVNFCAFSGDQFLGNTSTWRIGDGHSATENVFVIPQWRSRGIARNLLCAALSYLKEQGKSVATLGTYGTNKKAIRLYTRLGYELDGFRLTLGYGIE